MKATMKKHPVFRLVTGKVLSRLCLHMPGHPEEAGQSRQSLVGWLLMNIEYYVWLFVGLSIVGLLSIHCWIIVDEYCWWLLLDPKWMDRLFEQNHLATRRVQRILLFGHPSSETFDHFYAVMLLSLGRLGLCQAWGSLGHSHFGVSAYLIKLMILLGLPPYHQQHWTRSYSSILPLLSSSPQLLQIC